ncbi:hypothetical protein BW45_04605 [Agrobacterium tumefaciens]|nr:hypothetical protein BW45_04605 [Agrobacterium tumefaciens]
MNLEGPVFTGPFFLVGFRANAVAKGKASPACSRKGIFTLHHSALCFDDICRARRFETRGRIWP